LQDTGQRFADEHLQSVNSYVAVEHPVVGTEFVYGVPWVLSRTPGMVRGGAPLMGQHTRRILQDLLGLHKASIDRLERKGVLK
jgi:CoA:oxalate CoA-transferase